MTVSNTDENDHTALVMIREPPPPNRLPFSWPGVPDRLAMRVGHLALAWSHIDQRVDQIISGALVANGETWPGWSKLPFRKRKELFRAQTRKLFSQDGAILRYLDTVMADAATAHWKRNVVVHGKTSLHIYMTSGAEPYVRLIAEGTHNARPVRLELDEAELLQLFWDLGHIAGRLDFLTQPEQPFGPLTPAQRSAARDSLGMGPETPPK
jgi:hypothetical protein